nr:hypothetical protein [Tanacetum cinerariifolium]
STRITQVANGVYHRGQQDDGHAKPHRHVEVEVALRLVEDGQARHVAQKAHHYRVEQQHDGQVFPPLHVV